MNNPLITPEEAAAMKGVTTAAIYAAVKDNRLPHRRVLGRIGLRRSDVERWVPRSYQGRSGAAGGRPRGTRMSEESKARISASQKQRWLDRKAQEFEPDE